MIWSGKLALPSRPIWCKTRTKRDLVSNLHLNHIIQNDLTLPTDRNWPGKKITVYLCRWLKHVVIVIRRAPWISPSPWVTARQNNYNNFQWMSKTLGNCLEFGLRRSVIGLENSRLSFNQSDAKLKNQSRLSHPRFPALWTFRLFSFEF